MMQFHKHIIERETKMLREKQREGGRRKRMEMSNCCIKRDKRDISTTGSLL
jgi:hypothetical protein